MASDSACAIHSDLMRRTTLTKASKSAPTNIR